MDDDREVSRLFTDLRRSDEASAPGFPSVLARPRARRARPRFSLLRLAAAAVLVALIGVVIHLARRPAPERDLQAAARMLAEWKAPTDSLLHTPGSELLASTPHVITRVPNYSTLDPIRPERETTPELSR